MKKSYLLFVFAFVLAISSFAQFNNPFAAEAQTNSMVRLHLLMPGVGIDYAVGPRTTLYADLTFNGFNYTQNHTEVIFDPYISLKFEPRYFYNLEQRANNGKRTDYFSGQFVTFHTQVGLATENHKGVLTLAPMWGFQRTLGRKGYWSIQFGPGIEMVNGNSRGIIAGDLKFGFILN